MPGPCPSSVSPYDAIPVTPVPPSIWASHTCGSIACAGRARTFRKPSTRRRADRSRKPWSTRGPRTVGAETCPPRLRLTKRLVGCDRGGRSFTSASRRFTTSTTGTRPPPPATTADFSGHTRGTFPSCADTRPLVSTPSAPSSTRNRGPRRASRDRDPAGAGPVRRLCKASDHWAGRGRRARPFRGTPARTARIRPFDSVEGPSPTQSILWLHATDRCASHRPRPRF